MNNESFSQLVAESRPFPVFGENISKSQLAPIDLSINNPRISRYNLSELEQMELLIKDEVAISGGLYGFGGYIEQRCWYRRNSSFTTGEERDIHIGIDLWIPEQAGIYAPLDATVHSFKDNNAVGDYGPTIILLHEISGIRFHTLYGHLSRSSLSELAIGMPIPRGKQIGKIGDQIENTGWPTHLHFQIIIDMEEMFGDYPGVTSRNKLPTMIKNCPDPKFLAGLE